MSLGPLRFNSAKRRDGLRELHRAHPDWRKKQLAFEARALARQEFPEDALPSVGTIQRDMVAILGGGFT